jgi:hypothetical protein
MRTSSIEHTKKVKKYPLVLEKYFDIIDTIIEIKRFDSDVLPILEEVISCFRLNASPCFMDALVKFVTSLFQKDTAL